MGTVRYTVVNGEVLSEKRDGVRRFYVPDPLGSTVALLGSSQTKTDTYSYWPYGEERSSSGSTPTPFRFVGTAGYYRDNASRSYIRARHYHPPQGRFTSQDLLWGDPYNPRNLNRYSYGWNDPVNLVDPTGWGPMRDAGNAWLVRSGICGGFGWGAQRSGYIGLGCALYDASAVCAVFGGGLYFGDQINEWTGNWAPNLIIRNIDFPWLGNLIDYSDVETPPLRRRIPTRPWTGPVFRNPRGPIPGTPTPSPRIPGEPPPAGGIAIPDELWKRRFHQPQGPGFLDWLGDLWKDFIGAPRRRPL